MMQLVSRELFESRWNARFEDLLQNYQCSFPTIKANTDEVIQQAEYMVEKFLE